ncbi:MAG: SGNH/GDSL hydrolase family protein [Oligosphaeraceae bacterium]
MSLLWNRQESIVLQESVLFLEGEASPLRFPAQEILSVACPILGVTYQPGRDYRLAEDGNALVRPEGSSLPCLAPGDLLLSPQEARPYPAPDANAVEGGLGGTFLRFCNQDFFARHQVEVTYRAKEIPPPPATPVPEERLPRCRQRLAQEKRLQATFIGDSITEGYNATDFLHKPPFQPAYPGLMAREWESRGVRFLFRNRAIGGTESRQAMERKEEWRQDAPDLLVIAYGMNDLNTFDPQTFIQNLRAVQEDCRQACPRTEYLLVIPMGGNPQWKYTPPETSRLLQETVWEYGRTAPADTAVVDLYAFWNYMARGKRFHDLTGNGVNHPNDYGHRIYAAAILHALDPQNFPLE